VQAWKVLKSTSTPAITSPQPFAIANGRLLVTPELAQQASAIEKGVAYTKDGEPIAVYLGETAAASVLPALQRGEPLTGNDLQH